MDGGLKIIIEDKIPFIRGVLEPVADVVYLPSGEIDREAVREADALIVRTRNRCDRELLEGSKCSFIASATIGLDHVDVDYCSSHGIAVTNAPGCNAPAVAQYVMSSILSVYPEPAGKTLGIVGGGNIGKIVADWAKSLGMNILINDPPRAKVEGEGKFVSLATIAASADIITFHTPLTKSGEFPTYHLFDKDFAQKLERKPLIINAARGPIVDTAVLLEALADGKASNAVIDCWEWEPNIDRQLLEKAFIATPHIAGYSLEGKIRATRMAVDKLTEHFRLPSVEWKEQLPSTPREVSKEMVMTSYEPIKDTEALKSAPECFESQRNEYSYRHEPKTV